MRASDLIGAPAYDENGRLAGIVRDLRVDADRAADGSFPILGLVLSDKGARPAAVHACGFAQGQARGPALLRRIVGAADVRSRFVPVERILEWEPGRLKIRRSG
jgi:hypothetical protein